MTECGANKKAAPEISGRLISVCGKNVSKRECPALISKCYLLRNIASMNSFQVPISVSIIMPSLIVLAILRVFFRQVNTFTPVITIGSSDENMNIADFVS
ncbi:hypothetical protein [Pantoea anthophila]|uniref:hypothetical protein n=1 Tax=Pantoea anthophila TaxID=470931 RepID=UPI0027871537|nr:hypothetical protein [Pantoea anthophila]MDQ1213968.1 hypothetical protein [Pantoea anthophila]